MEDNLGWETPWNERQTLMADVCWQTTFIGEHLSIKYHIWLKTTFRHSSLEQSPPPSNPQSYIQHINIKFDKYKNQKVQNSKYWQFWHEGDRIFRLSQIQILEIWAWFWWNLWNIGKFGTYWVWYIIERVLCNDLKLFIFQMFSNAGVSPKNSKWSTLS